MKGTYTRKTCINLWHHTKYSLFKYELNTSYTEWNLLHKDMFLSFVLTEKKPQTHHPHPEIDSGKAELMVLVRLSAHRQASSDIMWTKAQIQSSRHTPVHCTLTCTNIHKYTPISRKDCSDHCSSFLSWLHKISLPHKCTCTDIQGCEGFTELGLENKNKPAHAEEIGKALG